jgi:hypothetical protein
MVHDEGKHGEAETLLSHHRRVACSKNGIHMGELSAAWSGELQLASSNHKHAMLVSRATTMARWVTR